MPEPRTPVDARLADLAAHLALDTGTDLVDAVLARLTGPATATIGAGRPDLVDDGPELGGTDQPPAESGRRPDAVDDTVAPFARRGRRAARWVPHPGRWAAAAVLVAIVVGSVAVGPVREAVAGWLGVDGVTIEPIDRLPAGLPDRLDLRALGEPTSLAAAQREVSFPIRVPAGFGPPDAYLDHPPGGVTLAWPEERVVVTEHPGDVFALAKGAPPGTTVEPLTVEGEPGFWITGGDHLLTEPAPPGGTAPPPRVTGNALVWSVDGIVHRLEVDGPLPDALALAATLR